MKAEKLRQTGGKILSVALCASLIALCAGLDPYAALAQNMRGTAPKGPGGANAVPGAAGAQGGVEAVPGAADALQGSGASDLSLPAALNAAPGALQAGPSPAALPSEPGADLSPAAQGEALPGLAPPGGEEGAPAGAPAQAGRAAKAFGAGQAGHKVGTSEAAASPSARSAQLSQFFDGQSKKAEFEAPEAAALKGAPAPGLSARPEAQARPDAGRRVQISGRAANSLQASPEPPAEAPAAKPGLLQRVASNFSLAEFNSSERAYMLGQAVFLFAISVYLASLPLAVKALTGSAAMTGVARAVHYWTFGGASLFAGAVVSRTPMKRVLVGAAATRAAIFGTIGLLSLTGGLPWGGFLALVGANALIVSMNHLVDIDTHGAAKIFGSDKKIEKAGYVYDFIYYGMMMSVPPLIGVPMDWLDHHYGAGVGAMAGFSLFAAVMGIVASIYAKRVKILGEEDAKAPPAALSAKLARWLKASWTIALEAPRRNLETLKLIVANKAILARSAMATTENFVEDALFAVVLPTYAIEILGAGAFGNGLLLAAITGGGLAASTLLMSKAQAIQKRIGVYPFIKYLTFGAALAFVPSIGLWAAPSLGTAVVIVAVMKFLYQPLRSRMRALLQTEIKNDPKAGARAEDIFSLMTFFEVLAAGAGGLAFSWLFTHTGPASVVGGLLGARAPMKVVTLSLAAVSVVYLVGLRWVRSRLDAPARKVFRSAPGEEAKAYEKLETNLKKMGLEPYRTETVEGPAEPGRPTVAVLAPASVYKLSIAREGGRQSSGDVHLVLDPSWLIQESAGEGKNRLLLTKGLYFDPQGRAVIAEYKNPRPVGYFADFYTPGSNDRSDGVPLEENLDVPMSSSFGLEKETNDKLLTRMIMAAKGIGVPSTLAFLMAAHPLAAQASTLASPESAVRVDVLPAQAQERQGREGEIKASVEAFLKSYRGEEVVVKPSGATWHSGRGVKFFKASDKDGIAAAVLDLASKCAPDEAVLVDSRVTPPPLHRDGRKMDWNLRVLAARTPWDGAATTGIFARVGPWGIPTTAEPADPRDAAFVVRYEDVIAELGLKGEEAREFRAELDRMGAEVLLALKDREGRRTRKDGEPYQAQTDYIGLDVMAERRNGKLVPVVIEVNDHDAGGQWQLDQFEPARAGAHSREWVATMLQRARRQALKGKNILVVGAGYQGKRFTFERAKELGVNVILLDKPDTWAKDLVAKVVPSDNGDLKNAAKLALENLKKEGVRVDGVTTFWEDDVPLAADIARALGKPFNSPESANAARSKRQTREIMRKAGLPTPVSELVRTEAELRAAFQKVGFPAVLKPVYGAEALGTYKVNSEAEAVEAYRGISATLKDKDSLFKTYGADMLFEQYLDGDEVDVDLVMQDGKVLFDSVTDNLPTREPYFVATGSRLPSTLKAPTQAGLTELAVAASKALGLSSGIVHVEAKQTSKGPRIIEVNARMGGFYVRDWVKAVWGVDLVEQAFYAAAGIDAKPFKPAPLTHLAGVFPIPEKAGTLANLDFLAPLQRDPRVQEARALVKAGSKVIAPPDGQVRVAIITAKGASSAEAQKTLDELTKNLKLPVE